MNSYNFMKHVQANLMPQEKMDKLNLRVEELLACAYFDKDDELYENITSGYENSMCYMCDRIWYYSDECWDWCSRYPYDMNNDTQCIVIEIDGQFANLWVNIADPGFDDQLEWVYDIWRNNNDKN